MQADAATTVCKVRECRESKVVRDMPLTRMRGSRHSNHDFSSGARMDGERMHLQSCKGGPKSSIASDFQDLSGFGPSLCCFGSGVWDLQSQV